MEKDTPIPKDEWQNGYLTRSIEAGKASVV